MKYNRMRKYFYCKKNLLWLGIGVFFFGEISNYTLGTIFPAYFLPINIICSLIDIVGFVIIGIHFGQKGRISDFEDVVDQLTFNFEKNAINEFDIEEKITNFLPPMFFKGYEFHKEDIIYAKRGLDGHTRSNGYAATFFCACNDKFYVYRKYVNFIENKPETIIKAYSYKDIGCLSYEPNLERTFTMKVRKTEVKFNLLTLTDSKGDVIFSTCIHEDYETLPTLEKINAHIEQMKSK